jgi:hypothetical protein
MDAAEQDLRDAFEELERELSRMTDEEANALVATICAKFAIETARID